MAYFPEGTLLVREIQNMPGHVYDPTDKYTIFVEDLNILGDEIVAIETYLHNNPSWPGVSLLFPFYNSAGILDTIALTVDNKLPFYKADGSASNIALLTS